MAFSNSSYESILWLFWCSADPCTDLNLQVVQTGIKNKKGLHKKKDSGDKLGESFHVNDISHPGNANKAKQHLAFLTRGKQAAVVEAVLSGNRLKASSSLRCSTCFCFCAFACM